MNGQSGYANLEPPTTQQVPSASPTLENDELSGLQWAGIMRMAVAAAQRLHVAFDGFFLHPKNLS